MTTDDRHTDDRHTDGDSAPAPHSPPALAERFRAIMADGAHASPGALKAALRRELHAAAVGLDEEGLTTFLAEMRSRFPDRMYEASAEIRRCQEDAARLKAELDEVRAARDRLARTQQAQAAVLAELHRAVLSAATLTDRGTGAAPPPPQRLKPLVGALGALVELVVAQEVALNTVQGSVRRQESAPRVVPELVRQLAQDEGDTDAALVQLRARLELLTRLPTALLTAMEQSWRSGTQAVVQHLSPKSAQEALPGNLRARVPGLKAQAIVDELDNRFSAFWNDMDGNVAHYFRGAFERIYTDKMEGGS